MSRSITARAALATAALAAASGCTRETDFDITQSFDVVTTGTSFTGIQTVNLADQAGSAWSHRNKVKKVTVNSVTGTIATVNPGNLATLGSGAAFLRPDGAPADGSGDVPLGSWTDVPITAGRTIDLAISPALNTAVNDALAGSGILSLVLDANADGTMNLVVEVRLRVAVEYRVP